MRGRTVLRVSVLALWLCLAASIALGSWVAAAGASGPGVTSSAPGPLLSRASSVLAGS